jgi:hypothetical protein
LTQSQKNVVRAGIQSYLDNYPVADKHGFGLRGCWKIELRDFDLERDEINLEVVDRDPAKPFVMELNPPTFTERVVYLPLRPARQTSRFALRKIQLAPNRGEYSPTRSGHHGRRITPAGSRRRPVATSLAVKSISFYRYTVLQNIIIVLSGFWCFFTIFILPRSFQERNIPPLAFIRVLPNFAQPTFLGPPSAILPKHAGLSSLNIRNRTSG